ncbi:MAG: hypothetical protein K2M76_04700, partial [Muribaculaceae bacterium]|nr:hypothetical protein [Muribaculaceae bacterium]
IDDKTAGISKIENLNSGSTIDFDKPYEVYDFSGVFVGVSKDNLDHGIYIIRQDSRATKIVIR